MDTLYAEAAYCTQGEEKARTLLESVRRMAEETNRWVQMAATLCQRAVFELETRAVEVDSAIEAGEETSGRPTYRCLPLETLEALEGQFEVLNSTEDMWPHFQSAVETKGVAHVDLLILAGVDPSFEANWAIQRASELGHLPIVERLLQDKRVDPSANNNWAIQFASESGHLPVVERLLQDKRVDPSANNNLTVGLASLNGHLPVVERLLQDALVDPSAFGNWAIRQASQEGHLSVVDRLLQDARVDPSAAESDAIRWASHKGHISVVERLLQDKRVDPSAYGNSAILWASGSGHLAIVARLLEDERVRSTLSAEELATYRSRLSQ